MKRSFINVSFFTTMEAQERRQRLISDCENGTKFYIKVIKVRKKLIQYNVFYKLTIVQRTQKSQMNICYKMKYVKRNKSPD